MKKDDIEIKLCAIVSLFIAIPVDILLGIIAKTTRYTENFPSWYGYVEGAIIGCISFLCVFKLLGLKWKKK